MTRENPTEGGGVDETPQRSNRGGLISDIALKGTSLGATKWQLDITATMVNACEWRHCGWALNSAPGGVTPPADCYPIKLLIDYSGTCMRAFDDVRFPVPRADIGANTRIVVYLLENEELTMTRFFTPGGK